MAEARTHLIWSDYHTAWHCRAADGSAAGYTTDIANAGLFETAKAMAYDSDGRNRAMPIAEAAEALRKRLLVVEATRDGILETLRALEPA